MVARPDWPPRSAPRLFVEQVLESGAHRELAGQQAHYLTRVMRVSEGDVVLLCDDVTGEWASQVEACSKRAVTLAITDKLREREDVPDFWLCPALLKKDRFDWVLEKATELGAARIAPVITRRCVADKLNLNRARTLVIEAAEQCARTALPALQEPVKLPQLLENWPADRTIFFADEDGGDPAAQVFAATKHPVALLIGPEGGFDDAERKMLREHAQVKPIALGPRILRGETAAIAAMSLWMGVSGDWTN